MSCFNHVLNQQGCDRHLLGMKIIAMEKGHKLPLLFQDKSYKLRWGTNQQLQKALKWVQISGWHNALKFFKVL